MSVSDCLIDSNILLRWVQPHLPVFPAIQSAIDTLTKRDALLCYTSQNLAEFWNACTRPIERNGFGLSPQDTDARARKFEDKLLLLPDSEASHHLWREMLIKYSVSGVQVHDARLVAAMKVHGIRHILTLNVKDFLRYNEIEALHPEQVK